MNRKLCYPLYWLVLVLGACITGINDIRSIDREENRKKEMKKKNRLLIRCNVATSGAQFTCNNNAIGSRLFCFLFN